MKPPPMPSGPPELSGKKRERSRLLKWLAITFGVLFVAALVLIGVVAHWFRESWNSGRFGARFMLLMAWDKELVSENPKKGLMTFRYRDGGRMETVSYKDYERGLIISRDAAGNTLAPIEQASEKLPSGAGAP